MMIKRVPYHPMLPISIVLCTLSCCYAFTFLESSGRTFTRLGRNDEVTSLSMYEPYSGYSSSPSDENKNTDSQRLRKEEITAFLQDIINRSAELEESLSSSSSSSSSSQNLRKEEIAAFLQDMVNRRSPDQGGSSSSSTPPAAKVPKAGGVPGEAFNYLTSQAQLDDNSKGLGEKNVQMSRQPDTKDAWELDSQEPSTSQDDQISVPSEQLPVGESNAKSVLPDSKVAWQLRIDEDAQVSESYEPLPVVKNLKSVLPDSKVARLDVYKSTELDENVKHMQPDSKRFAAEPLSVAEMNFKFSRPDSKDAPKVVAHETSLSPVRNNAEFVQPDGPKRASRTVDSLSSTTSPVVAEENFKHIEPDKKVASIKGFTPISKYDSSGVVDTYSQPDSKRFSKPVVNHNLKTFAVEKNAVMDTFPVQGPRYSSESSSSSDPATNQPPPSKGADPIVPDKKKNAFRPDAKDARL